MNRSVLDWGLSIVIFALVMCVLWAERPFGFLETDTDQFHEFASLLESGDLVTRYQGPEVPLGVVIRTPAYPVLLLIAKVIDQANLEFSLKLLHSCIAIAVFLLLSSILANTTPRSISALLLGVIYYKCRDFFSADVSEWLTINAILSCCGLAFYWLRTKSKLGEVAATGLIGLLPLFHPSLLFVPVVIAIYLLLSSRRSLIGVGCLILPLVFWMTLNLYRFGLFVLTPYSSMALFTIGASVGGVLDPGGMELPVRELSDDVRGRIQVIEPALYEDLKYLDVREQGHRFLDQYNLNMTLAKSIFQADGTTIASQYSLLKQYGVAAISQNLGRYRQFLISNSFALELTGLMLIPGVILPLYLLRRRSHLSICYIAIGMWIAHVAHILPVALISPVIGRYFSTSFYPLLFVSGILVWGFARQVMSERTDDHENERK